MVSDMQNTFVIVAILAVSILAAREPMRATVDLNRRMKVLDLASEDMNLCFDATERVSADIRVPRILRVFLAEQVMTLADPLVGKPAVRSFWNDLQDRHAETASNFDAVGAAIDQLACVDAQLAADCRAALAHGMMALVLPHSDNRTIEATAHEAVRSRHGVPVGVERLFGGGGLAPA